MFKLVYSEIFKHSISEIGSVFVMNVRDERSLLNSANYKELVFITRPTEADSNSEMLCLKKLKQ
jgi:hypothetical protein